MAAETITALNLQLVYGQRKENFELSLPVDEAGGVLQVRHLAKRVEDITGVPPANQRLIFRGKSLTNPSTLLIPDGIKNGSKIMLIGTKPSSEDDALIVKLNQAEKTLEKHKKRLSDITSDLDGIHRGFMSKEMQAPALNSLKKQLRGLVENLMKLLETMDGLLLSDSSVEVRAKRKKIVSDVNIYLGRCDDLGGGLEDLLLRYSN